MKAEVAAAEARGKAEAEKAGLQTALDAALSRAEAEQSSLQSSIHRLETESKDYKVSCVAHAAQLRMQLSSSSFVNPSCCRRQDTLCILDRITLHLIALTQHCKSNGANLEETLQYWQPCGEAFAGTRSYLVAAERVGPEQSQRVSCSAVSC